MTQRLRSAAYSAAKRNITTLTTIKNNSNSNNINNDHNSNTTTKNRRLVLYKTMVDSFETDVALLGRARTPPNGGRSPTALVLLREQGTRARTARLGAEHIQGSPRCVHLGRVPHENLRERSQHGKNSPTRLFMDWSRPV